jgi:deoxyadenosine/deoxycytidine kinase
MQDYIQETLMQLLTEIDNLKKTSRYQLIDDGINQAIEVVRKKMEEVQEKENNKSKNICVVGPIGIGKSYLLKKIQKLFPKIPVFNRNYDGYEDDVANYYRDKMKNTKRFQVMSLYRKLQNILDIEECKEPVAFTERCLTDNYMVFAVKQREEGFTSDAAWHEYLRFYNFLHKHISEPNLFLYFKGDPEFLLNRIHNERQRPGEEVIDYPYISDVCIRYEQWIIDMKDCGRRVRTIQVDHDFSDEEISEIVRMAVKEVEN